MIEELVLRLEAGDDSVVDELADLAAADPTLVAPYALRLVDAGVAWRADVLYSAGDEHFQRERVGSTASGLGHGSDLWDGEGAYYLFLHAPCGLAAADYQQS